VIDSTPPVLQAGASYTELCGVRDWATTLAEHLSPASAIDGAMWWERDDAGRLSLASACGLWRWRAQLRKVRPGATVLWHYSVFAYGFRGIPVFAPLAAWWARRSPAAVVVVLHEFAYPRKRNGWAGPVFAATTRVALVPVVWACQALIVATEERARWLRSRWWLPRRPVLSVPVSSTVPKTGAATEAEAATATASAEGPTVGVFMSASSPARPAAVTDAVARLRADGVPVRLVLFGGAGRARIVGAQWQAAARASGCETAVEFTGRLAPAQLATMLDDLDVIVAPSEEGPTSAKTTIASALAHGACVVAFSGPEQWDALVEERAVVMVEPDGAALAEALRRLLDHDAERRAQGERAADFYRRRMSPDRVAAQIREFVAAVSGEQA
jgi:glycosyltransferase involved in cell wall biosynthesis